MTDDQLLRQFIDENTIDVADNGFTLRVMRQLPDRQLQLNRIWTVVCAIAAIAVFFLTKGWIALLGTFHGLASDFLTTLPQVSPLVIFATIVTLTALTGYRLITSEQEL